MVSFVFFYFKNVVVVIEDKWFYNYFGVSLCGVVFVVCINLCEGWGFL